MKNRIFKCNGHIKYIPFIIFLLSLCATLPLDLYVSSLPSIAKALSANQHVTELTIVYFTLGLAGGQLFYGPYSDWAGRRKSLFIGLSVALAGSFICIAAKNILWIIGGRFLQGVGASSCLSLSRAIMRDCYSGKEMAKLNSYIAASVELIVAFSPLLGGLIAQYVGWRGIFYLFVLLFSLVFLLMFVFLPETNKTCKSNLHGTLVQNFSHLLKDKKFIPYAIYAGIAYGNLTCYFAITPFLLQKTLHLTPIIYGVYLIFISFSLVGGAIINASLIRWANMEVIIMIGGGIIFLTGLMQLIAGNIWVLSPALVLWPSIFSMLGTALLFSNCSAMALKHQNNAGISSAVYGVLQMLVAFFIANFVSYFNPEKIGTLSFTFLTLGGIIFLFNLGPLVGRHFYFISRRTVGS